MSGAMRRLRRARPHLGTFVEIEIETGRDEAETAFAAAFDCIARVEREMSFHDPSSDLSRLNREAAQSAQAVSPWLRRVLTAARRVHDASGGVFDPSVAGHLVEAGLLPKPAGAPDPDARARYSDVVVEGGRIRYLKPLWLDLNGIAKGFAVDVAVLALRALGIRQGCVNAGGDLRVFGSEPRLLHRRSSAEPGRLVPLGRLARGACATSAGYFSEGAADLWPVFDGAGRRLRRAEGVTVLAPDCLSADALTKVVALMPRAAWPGVLRPFRAEVVAS